MTGLASNSICRRALDARARASLGPSATRSRVRVQDKRSAAGAAERAGLLEDVPGAGQGHLGPGTGVVRSL